MEPDNIERYDRQMRLWGQHGQSKCSSARICLINANSLGAEILKGLCLAGIGSFTILDSHKLTPEDVGCSFLPQSCVGQSRAEAVKKMLLDLNEEVSGENCALEAHLPHVVQDEELKSDQPVPIDNIGFWKQFSCVIASGFLYIDQIKRLSQICWTINTPLILCRSIGFYGSMRSQFKEHLVIETHPDNDLPLFHLDKPFKDLKEYFDSINLEDDSVLEDVGKYPYIVIVYKYLQTWQANNNHPSNRLPKSYAEKKELRALIDQGLKVVLKKKSLRNINSQELVGLISQEMPFENYLDASKAVNSCFTSTDTLPDIFNHTKVTSKSNQTLSRFWIIIKAIKEFVISKNEKSLPVSGSIPDMTSSSEEYIRLQKIYAKKAREDVDDIFGLVQNYLNSPSSSPGSSLYEETKLVCKNIRDIRVLSTCLLCDEYNFKTLACDEENGEDEFATIELCLKALDLFFSTYGRLPGRSDDQVEPDISKLKECTKQIVGKAVNQLKTLDQCIYEVSRYGGSELHATSAFIGGCTAQEVIKLLTNQYVPVRNTLVYNAMTASIKTFNFSDIFTRENIVKNY